MSAARKARRMRDNAIAPGQNYGAKVEQYLRDHQPAPGSFSNVGIYHDNWCGLHKGGRCNCDPEVKPLRPPAGATALVLCARIGDVIEGTPLPPGMQTADCHTCGKPVWVTPGTVNAIRSAGVKPVHVCSVCVPSAN